MQECLGIAVIALLFAVHISCRVSLFPSFISSVIVDTSCYRFARGEFPSFEGYMFASNDLFNHTINETSSFLTFFASYSVWVFFFACFMVSVSLFCLVKGFLVSIGVLVSLLLFVEPFDPRRFSEVLS